MLPIFLLLDPDSLLAVGGCSTRLFRLVCDKEVWRHLIRRIPEFNLERLKDLGDFGARSDTRQDMIAEVLKKRASQLANRLCSERVGCRRYQLTLSIKNFPGAYKLYSCMFEKFTKVVEVMGSSTQARRRSLPEGFLETPPSFGAVEAIGSSPFNILELLSKNTGNCPLGWIAAHVKSQEEPLVKLRIGVMPLHMEGEDQDFSSLVKRSQRWEVGNLICECASNWAPVARFASTGNIACLEFRTDVGGLEKVNKEDARKIWEISAGIRVNYGKIRVNSSLIGGTKPVGILYFGRLGEGFWNLETGYQRRQEPHEEDFDPEMNWQWLVTFAGWEKDGVS